MIFITAAMAYVDFDDPTLVAVFFAVINTLVALATWKSVGLPTCLWIQLCVLLVVASFLHTTYLVNQTEVFAKQYHDLERELRKNPNRGPPSTLESDPPPTQPGRGFGCIPNLMEAAAKRMGAFGKLVLKPLQEAGGQSGRACEVHGPNLKKEKRTREKCRVDYKDHANRLVDLLRGTKLFLSLADANASHSTHHITDRDARM
jgi:hypothetical protein